METYYLFVFFIFGLVFGSFFNVVGYRLPLKMSLIKPSSHCPQCDHKLTALELIPVFSYLFQGGKCKNCGKKIPIFYPIFETCTGLIFAFIYYNYGLTVKTFIYILFASMILITIISDVLYMVISDEVLIFFGSIIFIISVINGESVLNLILNMLIPFLSMLLLKIIGDAVFKKESLGGGDIKLMLIFGLVLGYQLSLFSIVLAAFIALPISLINLKKQGEHILPFGPYLGISALIFIILKIDALKIIGMLGI